MIFARSSPAMRNRSTLPRGRLARQVKPRGASELLLPMPPKFVDRDTVDIRGAIGFAFVWRNDFLLILQSSNRKNRSPDLMRRRDFLAATAAAITPAMAPSLGGAADPSNGRASSERPCCGPTYASPAEAMRSPREKLLYATALYVGTGVKKPDYLATVDVDPDSPRYSKVVHRTVMPNVGDELHHFGWNACSSCHSDPDKRRRFIVLPGLLSGRIHILDAAEAAAPKLHKTIEPDAIAAETNLSAPHTVHCLPSGEIMISMLGDAKGDAPGGFLLLDDDFNVAGRWEPKNSGVKYNYDFWYQPRHDVMISSEWAAPNTFRGGFQLDDVKAGKYGSQLH